MLNFLLEFIKFSTNQVKTFVHMLEWTDKVKMNNIVNKYGRLKTDQEYHHDWCNKCNGLSGYKNHPIHWKFLKT